MAKKTAEEWHLIEEAWMAGLLSQAEICRKFNTPRSTAQKHMAKFEIAYGSQAHAVRLRIGAQMVAGSVAGSDAAATNDFDPAAAVEAAVKQGVHVIESHRLDITALQDAEKVLLLELLDNPKKLFITQHKGEIIQKEVGLTVTERLTGLSNLANVRAKRITLERQAYSLDDPDAKKDDGLHEVILHDPSGNNGDS